MAREALSIEETQKIAELALLHPTGKELTTFQRELTKILDYFGQLGRLSGKADKMAPAATPEVTLREDKFSDAQKLDYAGFLKVPKIMYKEGQSDQ